MKKFTVSSCYILCYLFPKTDGDDSVMNYASGCELDGSSASSTNEGERDQLLLEADCQAMLESDSQSSVVLDSDSSSGNKLINKFNKLRTKLYF